ncbi:hypothetical protein GUITHDRAFT_151207 [Guillardia theta CCMP2712]|uniref:Uncharacterized protein n=2 Tax=Guillardia theta TaxID=55529 RepID=L1JRB8_GUITC|nr:hypothetical protein GUITHDRAFT_151207 [Guillardia theta CCMP2712]EKX50638.1 hypothetical protein GUITHDRAFT_151207 [Guillardia theta CCMP2712]|mmetsp:Transcript_7177/g.24868  ORF Transcript_7177/g.24868 Transcript_7177/m.24868 type:complete len:135 (+) Transcript_7177:262-666(+)|eukprot:XP_005837618.1 hypothetical protein GUITHDRAFT_151207 [Guillardia theta CCMP2712]
MYFSDDVSSALSVANQNWKNEDALLDLQSIFFHSNSTNSAKSNVKGSWTTSAQGFGDTYSQAGLGVANVPANKLVLEEASSVSSYVIDHECCWNMLDRLHGAICPENSTSPQDKAKTWEMLDSLHATLYPNDSR